MKKFLLVLFGVFYLNTFEQIQVKDASYKRINYEDVVDNDNEKSDKKPEYVDLGLSVKWATCNVGANSPEEYGNYYAWGEIDLKAEYKESNCKTYGKQKNNVKGNSQYDVARASWGENWRMPTKSELEELKTECVWTWTTLAGRNGYMVTGPNGKSIFLPAAGSRAGTALCFVGTFGYYWCATPSDANVNLSYGLCFHGGNFHMFCGYRYGGRSVRPVME